MSQQVTSAAPAVLPTAPVARGFVTFRAVALGAVLLPLNTYWLTRNVWYQFDLSGDSSLFSTAVFVLVVLTSANWL